MDKRVEAISIRKQDIREVIIPYLREKNSSHVADLIMEADPLTAEHDKLTAAARQMREALGEIASLYDTDEGCQELAQYIDAQRAIAAYDALTQPPAENAAGEGG